MVEIATRKMTEKSGTTEVRFAQEDKLSTEEEISAQVFL